MRPSRSKLANLVQKKLHSTIFDLWFIFASKRTYLDFLLDQIAMLAPLKNNFTHIQ